MAEIPNIELSENYEFVSKKGNVKVSFGYEGDNFKFFAIGPKDVFANIVGGKGEENEELAWLTEEDLNTEEQRMYFMCELINKM